jgi:endonuclease/exonuclease/phosphatase (EEP) superfamily protein YafD
MAVLLAVLMVAAVPGEVMASDMVASAVMEDRRGVTLLASVREAVAVAVALMAVMAHRAFSVLVILGKQINGLRDPNR